MKKTIKILIAGEGGQGIQTIAKILTIAASQKNLHTLYVPNFGVEQRGGVSIAFVQISRTEIFYPKFKKADLLVVLSKRALKRSQVYLNPKTTMIFNSSFIQDQDLPSQGNKIPVDALGLASKKLHPRVFNIIILGVILRRLPGKAIGLTEAKTAIKKQLGYKFKEKPELQDLNYRALELGFRE